MAGRSFARLRVRKESVTGPPSCTYMVLVLAAECTGAVLATSDVRITYVGGRGATYGSWSFLKGFVVVLGTCE